MDNFIKNIKKKLSVDNLVDMIKDSKEEEKNAIKEEELKNTLRKLDPNSGLDVDEIHAQLNEIAKEKQPKPSSTSQRFIEAAKSGFGSLVSKKIEEPEKETDENEYLQALGREENVFNLYDDFH